MEEGPDRRNAETILLPLQEWRDLAKSNILQSKEKHKLEKAELNQNHAVMFAISKEERELDIAELDRKHSEDIKLMMAELERNRELAEVYTISMLPYMDALMKKRRCK
jgi:murein L,D-transpeptidase YafK